MINIIINSDMFSCNIILPEARALKFLENIQKLYMEKLSIHTYLNCKFEKQ